MCRNRTVLECEREADKKYKVDPRKTFRKSFTLYVYGKRFVVQAGLYYSPTLESGLPELPSRDVSVFLS